MSSDLFDIFIMTDKQKAKAWKDMAVRLSHCLNRHVSGCHELSHRKTEYHNSDEPCPVVAEILKTNEDFDNLLSNGELNHE